MLLQAALNGPWSKEDHPALPVMADELARDAVDCVAVGAAAVHLHPRDERGRERLDADVVDHVVATVRHACGVPVGVSTGAWIEENVERRVALLRSWSAPDYASVNVSEDGALAVARALIDAGVGIEAGVWTVEDAQKLGDWALGSALTRVLVEPVEVGRHDAVVCVQAIHDTLDRVGVDAPRLQHGDGEATWVLIEDAVRRGVDTRVGLEDTRHQPDGVRTDGNAALVRAAARYVTGIA
jgi:uncharacterized protein (DUF849 family)